MFVYLTIIFSVASVNIDIQALMGEFNFFIKSFIPILFLWYHHYPVFWYFVAVNHHQITVDYPLHQSRCLGTNIPLTPVLCMFLLPNLHLAPPHTTDPKFSPSGNSSHIYIYIFINLLYMGFILWCLLIHRGSYLKAKVDNFTSLKAWSASRILSPINFPVSKSKYFWV